MPRSPASAIALIAPVALALTLATGQPTGRDPSTASASSITVLPDGPVNPTIASINFPGGTFSELLEHIGTQIDLSLVNLVLKRDAANMPVEPLRVRDVTLGAILDLLVPVAGMHTQRGPDGVWYETYTVLETIPPAADAFPPGRPIHVLAYSKRPSTIMDAPAVLPRSFRIVSLAELGEDPDRGPYAIDTFLDLLQRAFSLSEGATPELSFHGPSAMLIAEVTEAQGTLLDQAYESFLRDERRRQDRLTDLRDERAAVLDQLTKGDRDLAAQRSEVEYAERRAKREADLADANFSSAASADQAQQVLEVARRQLANIESALESNRRRLEELTVEWDRLVPAVPNAPSAPRE